MIGTNILLQKLQPFRNKKEIIVDQQTTTDIINGIVETSKKYSSEYDKILQYFEDDDIIETAKNVFDFLKENCRYVIETTKNQTLRSPASIIATGKTKGVDCKQYSLFFMGILGSYIKKYKLKNKIFFRFAGYDNKDIGHVFVVFTDNGREYWCDCVLDYFNDRSKTPTKYKDKNMALISISGLPNIQISQPSWQNIGKSQRIFGIGSNGEQQTDWGKIAQQLFSLFGKKANPNDYVGWDALDTRYGSPKGWSAAYWTINDGDSVQNEASNILSYIQLSPNNLKDMINAVKIGVNMNETTFLAALKSKLERGASVPQNLQNTTLSQFIDIIKGIKRNTGGGAESGSDMQTQTAGFSPLIILALIGAGAYFFIKRK